MTSTAYRDVLARNVRIARAARGIGQQELAARMRTLGYDAWLHQTVGNVERGKRRIIAEEVLGLAFALETSVGALLDPSRDDRLIALPAGHLVTVGTVLRSVRHFNDGMVSWDGDEPRFATRNPESWPSTAIGAELRSITEFTSEDMIARNERLYPGPFPDSYPPPPNRGDDR
ncbi:MAG: helix-turn-helix domain-containing protein [Streptosporangiaceae bacterium]